ncbi:phosphoheptose isomerase, partial [Campylobacter jejuni]|nr:phosphoheptose isomerase [Campylobacter jejuni]
MENLNSYIKEHFRESILVKEQILKDKNLITLIKNASLEVIKAYKNGNKTLLAGNGG